METKPQVFLLTPTPKEFLGVKMFVENAVFQNFVLHTYESGPGKINAALTLAQLLTLSKERGELPLCVVGAGTSGSLDLSLKRGDLVASLEVIISDWVHDDGSEILVGPYATFDYGFPEQSRLDSMVLRSTDPTLVKFIDKLPQNAFRSGRILTSDAFQAQKDHKLKLGATYKALVCDMESGAFAWTAQKCYNIPWFNLRVVADTLDEGLTDYFLTEDNATQALGAKTLEALQILDRFLESNI
ncbi:MAG: hypothetical protein LBF22_11385 [Deltaproteobacteria bacterium]|jgi:nucleoside phosphorylase|nr:hypothetical protein [Deltaproteobacteria bacterium]